MLKWPTNFIILNILLLKSEKKEYQPMISLD